MSLENINILGIDDDPDIKVFLEKTLTEKGYSYHHCATLEEAEKQLKIKIPDLILLDIGLGEEYGLDIYDKPENQEKLKLTKVIVLSGANTPADVSVAVSIGVNDYIVKPVSPDVLLAKIQKHIN